ncbi:adenosylcobinamide-GDP ribazoletransferase [Gayadomonas joobiniege]|uniref:adenosylcobinamide-GDP ribazoletransferase n=1 Tax=Gayadomonas joobiniege TaxID=1234606 RepID=UPI000A57DD35|nr:adenosylcobinamide-GDP ribazoletransferase [Gayadomonas joobiniege]
MAKQLNLFFLALGFFSRLPIPKNTKYSPELLNQANRYFTAVGWLLAGLTLFVWSVANQYFSGDISVWITLIFSLFLTGVFHEDGLADTCDGFGGGQNKADKLRIMKDSRLGTYGVTGLFVILSGRLILWSEAATDLMIVIPVSFVISRCLAASFIYDCAYVQETDSKSKPLANQQSLLELSTNLLFALPVFCLLPLAKAMGLLVIIVVLRVLLKRLFKRQIGGYTGDNLGAVQQISELIIILVVLV